MYSGFSIMRESRFDWRPVMILNIVVDTAQSRACFPLKDPV
jgi:hypothetical protein